MLRGCQRGSNPPNHTFCTSILNCLLLASDTWHEKLKNPVTIEKQGLQAKNDPTRSEQLTTICSNQVGSFTLEHVPTFEPLTLEGNNPTAPYRPYSWCVRVRTPQILCRCDAAPFSGPPPTGTLTVISWDAAVCCFCSCACCLGKPQCTLLSVLAE